jgi:hypothetical protein
MHKYNQDFCIFILSHGRYDRIYSLNTLKNSGYTGKWYIVIDNEDKTADKYFEKYGEKVLQFNKKLISKTFDTADNFDNRKTIVYARNVCFELAKKVNVKYFMEFDDDYVSISYRFNKDGIFKNKIVKNFDFIIEKTIDFFIKSGCDCLAFAQGGDFIGGQNGDLGKMIKTKRKAMNTLLCSTENPFQFLGRINEDVNTYTRLGSIGKIFMTVNLISINQKITQSNNGGMTDVYLESGTYLKSFYSIIFNPSSVKIGKMGNKNMRIHHKIAWNNTVPKILDEKYKKG